MQKKRRVLLSVTAAVLSILMLLTLVYLNSFYPAASEALSVLEQEDVTVREGQIVFRPQGEAKAGLIFYPGGKVAPEAYAPLLDALAERGVLCVLVKMPFHLAVLSPQRADGIQEQFPEIERWYMAGHSLGGAMASSYIAGHTDRFRGLILLAAYSTADLSGSSLDVLTVYGSEDGVMNRDSYAKYASNLPADRTELVIDGGCHAYFGAYGPQDGDGTPTISAGEQLAQTVEAILHLMEPEAGSGQ